MAMFPGGQWNIETEYSTLCYSQRILRQLQVMCAAVPLLCRMWNWLLLLYNIIDYYQFMHLLLVYITFYSWHGSSRTRRMQPGSQQLNGSSQEKRFPGWLNPVPVPGAPGTPLSLPEEPLWEQLLDSFLHMKPPTEAGFWRCWLKKYPKRPTSQTD